MRSGRGGSERGACRHDATTEARAKPLGGRPDGIGGPPDAGPWRPAASGSGQADVTAAATAGRRPGPGRDSRRCRPMDAVRRQDYDARRIVTSIRSAQSRAGDATVPGVRRDAPQRATACAIGGDRSGLERLQRCIALCPAMFLASGTRQVQVRHARWQAQHAWRVGRRPADGPAVRVPACAVPGSAHARVWMRCCAVPFHVVPSFFHSSKSPLEGMS